jgi:small subunit ribosomal protein S11
MATKNAKKKRNVDSVIAHVRSTFNNTAVTITTVDGDVLLWSNSGRIGLKGSRRGTPFAGMQIGTTLGAALRDMGVKDIEVRVQGPGAARDSVVRGLQTSGSRVSKLSDVTPLPHNGCRPPKKRRV